MTDTNQITVQDAPGLPVAAPSMTDQLLTLAVDKNLDIDKLERLMEMKEREEAKTAYAAFVVAISNFQAECPTVKKTGTVKDKNGRQIYTYPKFDTIMKTIQPYMKKNGLSMRFNSDIADNRVKVCCKVSHSGGHTDESFFSCPVEASMAGGANASQRTASANSFAKRYAAMNALNIAGSDYDDDDAQMLGAEPTYITPEQAASLRDRLTAIDGDEPFFCSWLKKGMESLDNMPESMLVKAQKAITEQESQRS